MKNYSGYILQHIIKNRIVKISTQNEKITYSAMDALGNSLGFFKTGVNDKGND